MNIHQIATELLEGYGPGETWMYWILLPSRLMLAPSIQHMDKKTAYEELDKIMTRHDLSASQIQFIKDIKAKLEEKHGKAA
jgi:hypothetical protein